MVEPLPDPRLAKVLEQLDEAKRKLMVAQRTAAQEKGRSAKLRALIAQLKAQVEQPDQRPLVLVQVIELTGPVGEALTDALGRCR